MVLAALVPACRLAICPTSRSPLSVKPTTVGVVRPPSLLGTICTAPPSSTATQQFVVPKSMPTTLPITFSLVGGGWWGRRSRTRREVEGAAALTACSAAPVRRHYFATLTIAGRRSLSPRR